MILKASQRGGGMQLATHLLKAENEHVEVNEVSGFMSDDVRGAMKEAQAVAMGTRCKQHLFSVSLNPPQNEKVGIAAFESAIERIEKANGLSGQPRIVIFHEKEGRRHAHCVWSRIDAETMTARPLPFFKTKLREVSKGLYLEHGWQMPRGFMDSKERDPRNFSLKEWQQAKRLGSDPDLVKAITRECWSVSDGREAFRAALSARGLGLARGTRDYLVVSYDGRVHAIPRLLGLKTKQVRERLGIADQLKPVETVKADLAATVAPRLEELIREADRVRTNDLQPLHDRRDAMKLQHKAERQKLDDGQQARAVAEARMRSARLRNGVAGLWDRLTGQHGRTVKQNEAETLVAMRRDRAQRDTLVSGQLDERRQLQHEIRAVRHRHAANVLELHRDLARQEGSRENTGQERTSDSFNRSASASERNAERPRQILRGRTRGRDGPDLGR